MCMKLQQKVYSFHLLEYVNEDLTKKSSKKIKQGEHVFGSSEMANRCQKKKITPVQDETLKEDFDLPKFGQKFDRMQMH